MKIEIESKVVRPGVVAAGLLVALGALVGRAEVLLADPSVFHENGVYYLVGTEGGSPKCSDAVFPVYESKDLRAWRLCETPAGCSRLLPLAEAFGGRHFWAPQLFRRDGRFYFAYTADFHWGIATADGPRGPFRKYVEFPKQARQAIDPFVLQDDDGRVYAYYSCANVGGIACVELSADLRRFVSEPVRCIRCDQPWERLPLEPRYEELNRRFGYGEWERFHAETGTTEGPTVLKRHGKYVLFYSANDFRSPDYCVGVAVADAPRGPWRKLQAGPALWREQSGLNGTGHGDAFVDRDGALWYVFHAHNSGIRVSPRRTGIIRLDERVGEDGYPRYEAVPASMVLL